MFQLVLSLCILPAADPAENRQTRDLRVATFNTSLHRDGDGQLTADLRNGNLQARQIAAIIQTVRPDVILLNEFDFDAKNEAADLFRHQYLNVDQPNSKAIDYPYTFARPVNTGVPTGLDLDGNQLADDPADAFGFGRHPGQYGMLILSKLPIDAQHARTFRTFRWRDMPDAMLPMDPNSGKPFYGNEALEILRLSSKSHWDVPLQVGEATLHLLACHPTPPVFDGPEDRNGRRNFDEIRLWADYVHPDTQRSAYLRDDQGRAGGIHATAEFVIAGDLNADPHDGDSTKGAIDQLLNHPRINATRVPSSQGAVAQTRIQGQANQTHKGNPAHDTTDFSDTRSGNLRVDYLLPSIGLQIRNAGVFWPEPDEPTASLIEASDHRLVWMDISLVPTRDEASRN